MLFTKGLTLHAHTMIGTAILLVVVGQLETPPTSPVDLAAVLQRLGAAETLSVDTPAPCHFKDATTIEELDRKGAVEAREHYLWRLDRGERVVRSLVRLDKQGELSDVLRPRPEQQDKTYRSAFHPTEQQHFRFRMFGGPDPKTMLIQYAPFQPETDRMTGVAEVDLETMKVKSLAVVPSKMPAFVTSVEIRIDFGETSCGHMPLRISTTGEGGFLFYRKRFRSFTLLHDFEKGESARVKLEAVAVQ